MSFHRIFSMSFCPICYLLCRVLFNLIYQNWNFFSLAAAGCERILSTSSLCCWSDLLIMHSTFISFISQFGLEFGWLIATFFILDIFKSVQILKLILWQFQSTLIISHSNNIVYSFIQTTIQNHKPKGKRLYTYSIHMIK